MKQIPSFVSERQVWGKKSSPHPRGRASAASSVSGPWSGHSATGKMRRQRSLSQPSSIGS